MVTVPNHFAHMILIKPLAKKNPNALLVISSDWGRVELLIRFRVQSLQALLKCARSAFYDRLSQLYHR